jgi:glycerate 2-kinase
MMPNRASTRRRVAKGGRQARLCVLLAPCGFKENLLVDELIEYMAHGVAQAAPDAEILRAPMVDGGEGFTRTLVGLTGGSLEAVTVTGPVGQTLPAEVGLLGGAHRSQAVIEIAAAAGLRHVPLEARDPRKTTSYGVGELIRAALDRGASRLLIGCGDSGVSDGGIGLAEALGARALDRHGRAVGRGGGALKRLASVDLSGLDPRLRRARIEAAVNWKNVLLGPEGVARLYGPQKGASPEAVAELEEGLATLAQVIRRELGIDVANIPGGGASGGLGAGMHAFLGAKLVPRFKIAARFVDFDRLLAQADLVLTAEGRIDRLTVRGKMPGEIARRAKRHGVPVIALAGELGEGAEGLHAAGIDACFSVLQRPLSQAEAMAQAPLLVTEATKHVMRLVLRASEIVRRVKPSRGKPPVLRAISRLT